MPSWISLLLKTSFVHDESSMVQLGQSQEFTLHDWVVGKIVPSFWNKFPTDEEPNNRYKFVSLNIMQDKDLTLINRKTYSLLDWMGDLGGLNDCLIVIGSILVQPFQLIALKAKLVSTFKP